MNHKEIVEIIKVIVVALESIPALGEALATTTKLFATELPNLPEEQRKEMIEAAESSILKAKEGRRLLKALLAHLT